MIKINSHRLNKDNAVDFFSEWSGQALQKKAEEPTYSPEQRLGVLRPNDIQQLYAVGKEQGYGLDEINALLMYSGDTLLKNTAFGVASDRTKSELAMAAAGIPIGAILGGLLGGGKGMLAGSVIGTIALYIMSKFGVGVEEAMSYSQDTLATRNTQAIKNLLSSEGKQTEEGKALARKIESTASSPEDIDVGTQLDLLAKANSLDSAYKSELAKGISVQLRDSEGVNPTAKYEGFRTLQTIGYATELSSQELEKYRQGSALYEANKASNEAITGASAIAARGGVDLNDAQKRAIAATAYIRSINQSELENVKNRIATIKALNNPILSKEIPNLNDQLNNLSAIDKNLAERAEAAGSPSGYLGGEDAGVLFADNELVNEVPKWAQSGLSTVLNPTATTTPATTEASTDAAEAPATTQNPPKANEDKVTRAVRDVQKNKIIKSESPFGGQGHVSTPTIQEAREITRQHLRKGIELRKKAPKSTPGSRDTAAAKIDPEELAKIRFIDPPAVRADSLKTSLDTNYSGQKSGPPPPPKVDRPPRIPKPIQR